MLKDSWFFTPTPAVPGQLLRLVRPSLHWTLDFLAADRKPGSAKRFPDDSELYSDLVFLVQSEYNLRILLGHTSGEKNTYVHRSLRFAGWLSTGHYYL